MAQQRDVQIFFKVDGLEQYITSLEQLDEVLRQVKGATEQTEEATNKLQESTDKFDDLETKLQSMEGATKALAGGLEFLTGAVGLLGLEDNPFFAELEQNTLQILALARGAIDLSEGVSLLAKNQKLATAAQAAFNVVANANPYVLLATAVIALGGALLLLSNKTKDTTAETLAFNKALKDGQKETERSIDFDKRLADARGQLNDKRLQEFNRTTIQSLIEQNDRISDQIYLLNSRRSSLSDEEKQTLQNYQTDLIANNERINALNQENILIDERIKTKKREDDEEAARQRREESRKKKADADQKKRDEEQAARDAAKKAKEDAEALNKQQIADRDKTIFDEQASLQEELFRASLDQREIAFRDLEDDYYRRINLANGNAELLLQIEEQYRKDKDALTTSFNDVDLQKQIEYNQMVLEAEQGLQDAKFGIAKAGVELFTALAGENEKAANIAFAIEKALAVGEVVVNLQRELAANRSNPTWKLLPDGGATLITAANAKARISAGISIASILATTIAKFKNGSGNLPSSGDNTSPSGALGVPQINYNFAQNAGGIQTPGGIQSQPVKAYVLVSDVNNAQQANNQIERYSRL